jgi:hypothetical protein
MSGAHRLTKLLWQIGRAVGALVAAIAAVMWVYAMWAPDVRAILAGWSLPVAMLMMFLSLLAVIAAIRGHGNMMLAMFLGSFLPVGAVLMRVDHWLSWIGVLNLILCAAALVTRWTSPRQPTES